MGSRPPELRRPAHVSDRTSGHIGRRKSGTIVRMLGSHIARTLAALLLALALMAGPAVAGPRATTRSDPPAAKGAQIARLFQRVTRDTKWNLVDSVRLQAETWHPEGIVK